jgi:hypothetical protein
MSEDITRMRTERISAAARLNALLAVDPSAPVGPPLRPSFPDTLPPLDSLVAEAERNRPMVQAAEAELRAADAGVRLARREIWPDLQLGIQYGQRPMDDGTDRMISLMLGFNVPIFAGSRQLAMRREATAMRQMAAATSTPCGPTPGGWPSLCERRAACWLRAPTRAPSCPRPIPPSPALAAYRVGADHDPAGHQMTEPLPAGPVRAGKERGRRCGAGDAPEPPSLNSDATLASGGAR